MFLTLIQQGLGLRPTIMFNNFFTNIGIKLANDITVSPDHNCKDYLFNEPGVSFSFKSVSELETNNIIDKLRF